MNLRSLWTISSRARSATVVGLLLLAAAAAAEVMTPWPMKWLVDHVLGTTPATGAIGAYLGNDKARGIAAVCAAVVLLALGHRLLLVIAHNLLVRAGNLVVEGLRGAMITHLLKLPPSYHDEKQVGDSVYRLTTNTLAGLNLVSQVIAPAAAGVLVLGGILTAMLLVDVTLTLFATLCVPTLWVLIILFNKSIERRAKKYQQDETQLASHANETLGVIKAVQAFAQESRLGRKLQQQAGQGLHAMQRLVLVQLFFGAAVAIALAACTAGVVYVGAWRVTSGALTLGEVLVFITYVGLLYAPVSSLSQAASALPAVQAQLARVFEVLETKPAVDDAANATALKTVRGDVALHGVTFAYGNRPAALKDVSLKIPAGSSIALVGRTGSGKSTLINMLMRFYDPAAGRVELDGVDIRQLPLRWLRAQHALVMQDAMLISGTIAENIRFARPDATPEEVRAAAKQAQADEFIESLPNGYDTLIGERGVNLSGGQRQRLSLARAFLINAPILILDEPTSALDAHTEAALVQGIKKLAVGRTTIMVAHRLSTIRLCDRIAVMDQGELIECGTHDELMGYDSAYRRLYRTQWGTQEEQELETLATTLT